MFNHVSVRNGRGDCGPCFELLWSWEILKDHEKFSYNEVIGKDPSDSTVMNTYGRSGEEKTVSYKERVMDHEKVTSERLTGRSREKMEPQKHRNQHKKSKQAEELLNT